MIASRQKSRRLSPCHYENLQKHIEELAPKKQWMKPPMIFKRLINGIRIQELNVYYYAHALNLIEDYYFTEEILCKNLHLHEEPDSNNSYLKYILEVLEDSQVCLIAIDEANENEVAGVLIQKVLPEMQYGKNSTRMKEMEGWAISEIIKIFGELTKINVYSKYACDTYLQCDILCITPEYRSKGLGFEMMETGLQVARLLNIIAYIGIFTSDTMQRIAEKVGMKKLNEVFYSNLKLDDELLIKKPSKGNISCALMGMPVVPYIPREGQNSKESRCSTGKSKRKK